jgi:hypothetical protein
MRDRVSEITAMLCIFGSMIELGWYPSLLHLAPLYDSVNGTRYSCCRRGKSANVLSAVPRIGQFLVQFAWRGPTTPYLCSVRIANPRQKRIALETLTDTLTN